MANDATPRALTRAAGAALMVGAGYYLLARAGLLVQVPGTNASPVWPAAGLAVGALLLAARARRPGLVAAVAAGAALANVQTLSAGGWPVAIGIAVGNAGAAWLIALAALRFARSAPLLSRVVDVLSLTLAAALGCAVAASTGAANLLVGGVIGAAQITPVWLTWWLGDFAGVLLVVPLMLAWAERPRGALPRPMEAVSVSALVLAAAAVAVLPSTSAVLATALLWLVFPATGWLAFRCGARVSSTLAATVAAVMAVCVWRLLTGAAEVGAADQTLLMATGAQGALRLLQVFLVAQALTAALFAAATRERAAAAAATRASERRFRASVESAPTAMVMTDAGGHIVLANAEAERLFGWPRDGLLGQAVEMLVPDAARASHPGQRAGFAAAPRARQMGAGRELFARRRDGSEFPVEIGLNPVITDDGAFVMCAVVDISRRKALEGQLREANDQLAARVDELARSNEELQQFAYVASHDLQTPLRTISGFAQMLSEDLAGTSAQVDDWTGRIVRAAERMQNLIHALLEYARVDTRAPAFAAVDLGAVVAAVQADFDDAAPEAGTRWRVHALPPVLGDRAQLAQLMQNLLGNAIKYRGADAPVVDVSAAPDDAGWRVTVQDNGIGIEPQFRERVFEIFRRLHSDQKYPGTGIGLAVCRRIVERHGGRIWVEGAPGGGSRFCFTLPRVPQPPEVT